MKRTAMALCGVLAAMLPAAALADASHDGHHPAVQQGQTAALASSGTVYSANEGDSTISALDLAKGTVNTVASVRRRMIWNRRPDVGLEGSGSVG